MLFAQVPALPDTAVPAAQVQRSPPSLSDCKRSRPQRRAHSQRSRQSRGSNPLIVRAQSDEENFSLAAAKPKSPIGVLLAYYLQEEPHLFKDAIESQLGQLRDAKEAEAEQKREASSQEPEAKPDKSSMVLYRRMEDLKRSEQQATLEDLMYASVLEKFLELGCQMLPRMDSVLEAPTNLKALTEGLHSKEALEHVRQHVRDSLGPAANAFSATMLKMSKLQGAQVYAQAIMFGYFVRRVDKRFQLEKSLGTLMDQESVNRLERLFNAADQIQEGADPDAPSTSSSSSSSGSSPTVMDLTSDAQSAPSNPIMDDGIGPRQDSIPVRPQKVGRLREYIEKFDQNTLWDMSRILSQESVAIVETQTSALFGDIRKLQEQMQSAVGRDVTSYEELLARVQQLVSDGTVESLVISVGMQRRAVLEAVAFGTFLRDVEEHVGNEYDILTPARMPPYGREGGGRGGGGGNVPTGPSPLAGV